MAIDGYLSLGHGSLNGITSGTVLGLGTVTIAAQTSNPKRNQATIRITKAGSAGGWIQLDKVSAGSHGWRVGLYIHSLPASGSEELVTVYRAATSATLMVLRVTSGGVLQMYAANGTTLVGSSTATVSAGTYVDLGGTYTAANTANKIYLDGVEAISVSRNWGGTWPDCIRVGPSVDRSGADLDIEVFEFVSEGAAALPAYNRVACLDLTGDGAFGEDAAWADPGSSSQSYTNVAWPADGDTTSLQAQTGNSTIRTFTVRSWEALGIADTMNIHSVTTRFIARRTSGTGGWGILAKLYSGGSSLGDVGNQVSVNTYAMAGGRYLTDAGAAAWTKSAAEAVEVGFQGWTDNTEAGRVTFVAAEVLWNSTGSGGGGGSPAPMVYYRRRR